jgi:hypothetical protein
MRFLSLQSLAARVGHVRLDGASPRRTGVDFDQQEAFAQKCIGAGIASYADVVTAYQNNQQDRITGWMTQLDRGSGVKSTQCETHKEL